MIPLDVRNTPPMLARPAPGAGPANALAALARHGLKLGQPGTSDVWSYEIKFDGIRCMATVENGSARLLSRTGNDLTPRHRHIAKALEATFPAGDVMLDGELVCVTGDGTMTFADVARRGSKSVLMVFDVLYVNSPLESAADLRGHTYDYRGLILDRLGELMTAHGDGKLFRAVSFTDGGSLWDTAMEYRMEGLVAKRRDARYAGGQRNGHWLKIKAKHRVSALVTGLEAGEGSRASTFGALEVSLRDGQEWIKVGTVGSGFSDRDLAEVVAAITTEQPVVIDVEYLAFTRDGRLREPVYVGLRHDIKAAECTLSQISVTPSIREGR